MPADVIDPLGAKRCALFKSTLHNKEYAVTREGSSRFFGHPSPPRYELTLGRYSLSQHLLKLLAAGELVPITPIESLHRKPRVGGTSVIDRRTLILALACLCLAQTGCWSRRGGTVGPFPKPYVPKTVVFVSTRDEGKGEIYSMLDDGTHVTRLTFNAVQDAAPCLSPDGAKITFRRELNPSNVFVMNVDGTSAIGLAPGERAEWSPDGSKLALVSDTLAVMNADATGIHHFGVGATYVSWSPDGSQLAYISNGVGGQVQHDIYTINANGTGAQRITTDQGAKHSLSWSPDGTKLVYSTSQGIIVLRVDGSAPPTSPCLGMDARWSPDGQRIIFVTHAYDGNDEIYSVRLDGTDLKNMSHNPAVESEPDWGPRE